MRDEGVRLVHEYVCDACHGMLRLDHDAGPTQPHIPALNCPTDYGDGPDLMRRSCVQALSSLRESSRDGTGMPIRVRTPGVDAYDEWLGSLDERTHSG